MYLFVLSENLKTSLRSRTTVFPGFAGTFSFGARLTPLNLAALENYCIPRLRRDLLLRSKVNTLKPRFAREKEKAAF